MHNYAYMCIVLCTHGNMGCVRVCVSKCIHPYVCGKSLKAITFYLNSLQCSIMLCSQDLGSLGLPILIFSLTVIQGSQVESKWN